MDYKTREIIDSNETATISQVRAKKSFGQNFLKDKNILKKIITGSEINEQDIVVEIGPGTGNLTTELLNTAKKVIAVELDKDMIIHLKERFKDNWNFILEEKNVLKFNPEFKNYKIVANIPYNITGKILRHFLEEVENKPRSMTLMVQKEVANKIIAKAGDHNLLSLSVQVFAEVRKLFNVSRSYFNPAPNVDSAVIHIKLIEEPLISNTKLFFEIIRKAFQAKRKTLKHSLKLSDDIFEKLHLKTTARPQELTLENWEKMIGELEN